MVYPILSPLLAFGFASTWLLWGLALGVLPPLIHLLNRRRYRETQWAAMRFLIEAVRKNSRRMRIEQLLLLLVRIAIIVLLVLGLAQPQLQTFGRLFASNVPTHRIVVIDTSFSMSYEGPVQSRFKQAVEIAEQVIGESRQGDAINLVRISATEPRVVVRKPAFQADDVLREIQQLGLADERGDLYPSLLEVDKLLQSLPELPQKEVVIISDFQQSLWQPDGNGKPLEIRSLLKKFGDAARLLLVDVGQSGQENYALLEVSAQESFHSVNTVSRFRVAASTFSRGPAETQLEFYVDGKLQASRKVTLQPSTETTEDFAYTFATGGEHLVQARLTKDALPLDDQRQLVVRVKDRLQVLCVNGKLTGKPRDTATFHVQLALAPNSKDSTGPSLIQPRVIKYGELRGFDLSEYDCVFLCDVASFDLAEVQLLENYLKAGGGLIWSLGERVDVENYNRLLFRDGQGILPAKLLERRRVTDRNTEFFGFDPLEFQHPIVKVFQGNPDAGLERTQTFEYFRTSLAPKTPARVALAFSTGEPAILDSQSGAGKSMMITTAVDQSWGNWPVWPSFLPLIQELVLYSVSHESQNQGLLVGEAWQKTIQTRGAEVSATIVRPDGETELARSNPGGSLTDFHYDRTDRGGLYQLQIGSPLNLKENFAVNLDPRESNLTRIEKEELGRELLAGADYRYLTDWTQLERRASGTATESGDLSQFVLYGVLYLLFVEQLMAWNFQYGVWLLFPPAYILHRLRK